MSSKAKSSAAMNGDKPLRKRKKKMPSPSPSPSPVTEQTSIMSLPNDLLLSCIARVSRLDYRTLSFVCKTFRSIVASPELYETRARLNRTEKCLYLGLHFPFDPITHWCTLYRQPKGPNKYSGYLLVEIPSPNDGRLPSSPSSVISVGSDIYKIGGADSYGFEICNTPRCCYVSVMDCRSHRWRQTRSMQVARSSTSTVSVVDGKIYVAGGCKDNIDPLYWIEVFDPKTQTWGTVTNPCIEFQYRGFGPRGVVKSLGLEGKLYMFGSESVVYNPKEGKWNNIGVDRLLYRAVDTRSCENTCSCVIDDVLFIWDKYDEVFKWYDSKLSLWKNLNGLEGLPDFRDRKYCKMVDFGGKMAVLWDQCLYLQNCKEDRYWCAEISLEKRDGDEIWGKVEWFDLVLRVHTEGMLCNADVLLSADVLSAVV